jgi:hypothetical protein
VLTLVILATQEDCSLKPAWVNSSVRPYLKKNLHKKRAGGVAQGVGPEFKPQYWKKKVIFSAECFFSVNIFVRRLCLLILLLSFLPSWNNSFTSQCILRTAGCCLCLCPLSCGTLVKVGCAESTGDHCVHGGVDKWGLWDEGCST